MSAIEVPGKRGAGQPPAPYKSRVVRLPNLGAAGRQFQDAYAAAMKQAAKRKGEGDRFVFLWRESDSGEWRIAEEREQIPDTIHWMTEGVLLIYASGDVGISS